MYSEFITYWELHTQQFKKGRGRGAEKYAKVKSFCETRTLEGRTGELSQNTCRQVVQPTSESRPAVNKV